MLPHYEDEDEPAMPSPRCPAHSIVEEDLGSDNVVTLPNTSDIAPRYRVTNLFSYFLMFSFCFIFLHLVSFFLKIGGIQFPPKPFILEIGGIQFAPKKFLKNGLRG
jgi:hypothetical protein